MAYEIIGWKNKGETGAKPINRDNLRHMDNGILNLDTYKAEIMPLLTVSDTAPVECERGDLYYNTTTELIYVATQPDTWSEEGTTPSIFNLYVDLSSSKLYYYDGTNFNSYGSGGGGETLPIGIILPFSDDTIPEGYMLCDGRAISRTTYSSLFSIIGTTYGEGDGSTTFNIPNLKGKVLVGQDTNDTDFDTLGETGGEKTHTLTVDEMPSHSHNMGAVRQWVGSSGNAYWLQDSNQRYAKESQQTSDVGGGQPHNNLPPYQVGNYIIKVSQTTATQAQVVDGYSASTTDSYSCNYVNGMNTYSTDEIRIGTWIDGKPIYRKVYIGNNPTTGEWAYINTDNTYNIKMYKGFYQRTNNRLDALSVGREDAMPLICTIRNNQIEYKIDSTYASGKISVYFILEYTKTTD